MARQRARAGRRISEHTREESAQLPTTHTQGAHCARSRVVSTARVRFYWDKNNHRPMLCTDRWRHPPEPKVLRFRGHLFGQPRTLFGSTKNSDETSACVTYHLALPNDNNALHTNGRNLDAVHAVTGVTVHRMHTLRHMSHER